MKKFGILVPIVTPCAKTGEIDSDGLKSVCSDMINNGCSGIFAAGSTGRGPWFNRDDRVRICKTIAGHINRNVPLFAGCMGTGINEMIENSRAMADAGADIAVITAPYYFNYNQDEVEHIFLKFADASLLPVLIYDIPGFAGMKLDFELVSRLARHENIIGFKDSSADLERFKELTQVLRDKKDFYILQGKEHILADSLIAGASGFVVSLLHIDPTPFIMLYKAVHSGKLDLAFKIQKGIDGLYKLVIECFEKRPETSTLFYLLNYSLRERGVCDNILLEHEDSFPDWLTGKAQQALSICKSICEIKE